MKLEVYVVSQTDTIRKALAQIDENKSGSIFICDETGCIQGMATDGDIRRGLLQGLNLDDAIASCANSDFISVEQGTGREKILKYFDRRIRIIPVLDKSGRLSGILTKDNIPGMEEDRIYSRAKSPVRVSFGGGGSDLTHYFVDESGAVINATISLFSHATLKMRDDQKVIIDSRDLEARIEAEHLEEALVENKAFALIQAVLKSIRPDFGFELYIHSDFPMKSGLGGSAVVASAIFGCFNEYRRDKWTAYEIAELAYQAERIYLGVAGGWQDQYATVFGGFNFMEFQEEQNLIHSLRIPDEILLELEESLVLCNTGTIHDSGDVHEDQKKEMSKENVKELVKKNVALTYQMRNQLLRGELWKFGESLDTAWNYKRQFSSRISTGALDRIYEVAKEHGAIGGKLLGAGGGGFFIFYVPAARKTAVMNALEKAGTTIAPFRFESQGLRSWKVRDRDE